MTSYLQIDNLTKSFGDLVLFENISFGIAEGQRIGLIAKNGTGKTTLLNVISGKEGILYFVVTSVLITWNKILNILRNLPYWKPVFIMVTVWLN